MIAYNNNLNIGHLNTRNIWIDPVFEAQNKST